MATPRTFLQATQAHVVYRRGMSTPEERLSAAGLTLPAVSPRSGAYTSAVRFGDVVYLSGHASRGENGWITGTLGKDLDVEAGRVAARAAALACLASLKAELGDLGRVARILKVTGYVHATPEFEDHPRVMDACSSLLIDLFAPNGAHARTSIGLASLPHNVAVEIDMVVAVSPE